MKVPYQATSLVLLFVSGFVGFESWKMKIYTPLGPGPGFFPLCLAVLLAILSIAMFVQATYGKPMPQSDDFVADVKAYRKMGAVAVAVIFVVLFLEPLGFCLSMLVFYLFLLSILDRQGWLLKTAIASIGSFGTYYIFTHWLSSPLPAGLLGI